jgi:hypothetical protein
VADRDLGPRLPEVELADLPGPVDGALIGAPRGEPRADLAQVLVEDRLPTLIAELGDQLADAGARQAMVGAQQALDLLLERVELGGLLLASPVGGRALGGEGPPDRFPVQAGAAGVSRIETPSKVTGIGQQDDNLVIESHGPSGIILSSPKTS